MERARAEEKELFESEEEGATEDNMRQSPSNSLNNYFGALGVPRRNILGKFRLSMDCALISARRSLLCCICATLSPLSVSEIGSHIKL